jgi:sigma-E factor negative regulatory protein RseC
MKAQPTRVVAIDGNLLTVAVDAAQACSGCRSKSACGSGDGSTHQIEVTDNLAHRLRTGDQVSVLLDDGATLRALVAAYLVPLAGFLAGIIGGSASGLSEGLIALCGVGGLLAGLAGSRRLARRWRTSLQPQVCSGG